MSLGPQPEPPTVAQSPSILLQEAADGPMTLQGHTHRHMQRHTYTHHTHSSMSRDAEMKLQTSTHFNMQYMFINIVCVHTFLHFHKGFLDVVFEDYFCSFY